MLLKGAAHARSFGTTLAGQLNAGEISGAFKTALPYLNDRNPFRLLDLVGEQIAACQADYLFSFLNQIADTRLEGVWVIIASALFHASNISVATALEKSRKYIKEADIWYAADIFGERVPGPFLVRDVDQTLAILDDWRFDPNAWARRTIGVAAHFWAKRTKGSSQYVRQAQILFTFLSPVFEEQDIRAAKGIGWGLKTLGRYYPDIARDWLFEELITQQKKPRAITRRKALTYLPDDLKASLLP